MSLPDQVKDVVQRNPALAPAYGHRDPSFAGVSIRFTCLRTTVLYIGGIWALVIAALALVLYVDRPKSARSGNHVPRPRSSS